MSARRIVISSWLVVISWFFATSPVLAQEALNPNNFNYFINAQTTIEGAIGHTIFCSLAGVSPLNENGCLGYSAQDKKPLVFKQLPSGGAFGALGSTMVALYSNPPASSAYYLAHLGESVGLSSKPAYAQVGGSGEKIIAPIFKLWQTTRNMAYLAFIVVFLTVGLMIMFRRRINPQTIISAQAALPSLVIGLILVTFSYFIAALAIDLAFVGIQLVVQLFISSGLTNSLGDVKQAAQNSNIFQLFYSSGLNLNNMGAVWQGVSGQFSSTLGTTQTFLIPAVIGAVIGTIVAPGAGTLLGLGAGTLGGYLVGGFAVHAIIPIIVILILLIALFIQMFRLVFSLLGSYIQILVFALAGPFFILIGSIPGRGGSISAWFRGLIANALVFPVVFAVFLFAGVILGSSAGWSNTTLPLFGGVDANFIRVLIAYGILLGSPSVPDMVRAVFGVKGPQGLTQAALAGFMGGAGAGQAGMGTLTGGLQAERRAYLEAVTRARIMAGTHPPPSMPSAPRPYEFWKWGIRR